MRKEINSTKEQKYNLGAMAYAMCAYLLIFTLVFTFWALDYDFETAFMITLSMYIGAMLLTACMFNYLQYDRFKIWATRRDIYDYHLNTHETN